LEDDGRRTVWKPIFDKEPVASIGALALAPSNPKIIYVGTGVNTIFADSNYGDEFTNRGWRRELAACGVGGHAAHRENLIDPRNPDVVLVAAMGHSSGPNEERGVFRSHGWRADVEKSFVQRQCDGGRSTFV